MMPRISVVIPTHNGAERLRLALTALGRQTTPADVYEVVVVADGCSDGTCEIARAMAVPYHLVTVEQPAAGRALARNAGAARATGELLLFLDDDMIADPGLIAAHLLAHSAAPDSVVIGYFPLSELPSRASILELAVKGWWDSFFTRIANPDHRFTYRDFCTGNVSLPRSVFDAVGGFDASLGKGTAGEDWELGYRLIKSGVRFRYAPAAKAVHHDRPSLKTALRRSREEGAGHCRIVSRHPELFPAFNLSLLSRLHDARILRQFWRLLWVCPLMAGPPVLWLHLMHWICEKLKLYTPMWRAHAVLAGHAYWKGARSALGSFENWGALRAAVRNPSLQTVETTVDLQDSPEQIAEVIEDTRPDAVQVCYRNLPVCRIEATPGAEPLRWPHVRTELVERYHWTLQWALFDEMSATEATAAGISAAVVNAGAGEHGATRR